MTLTDKNKNKKPTNQKKIKKQTTLSEETENKLEKNTGIITLSMSHFRDTSVVPDSF